MNFKALTLTALVAATSAAPVMAAPGGYSPADSFLKGKHVENGAHCVIMKGEPIRLAKTTSGMDYYQSKGGFRPVCQVAIPAGQLASPAPAISAYPTTQAPTAWTHYYTDPFLIHSRRGQTAPYRYSYRITKDMGQRVELERIVNNPYTPDSQKYTLDCSSRQIRWEDAKELDLPYYFKEIKRTPYGETTAHQELYNAVCR